MLAAAPGALQQHLTHAACIARLCAQIGLGVVRPIKKKKRRNSTPSSPSFSLSPSPPAAVKGGSRQPLKQEPCWQQGGLSSGDSGAHAPAHSAAAGVMVKAEQGQQQQQQVVPAHYMQQLAAPAGGQQQASSCCYSPCSQTAPPPGLPAVSLHNTQCVLGPDGLCTCPGWTALQFTQATSAYEGQGNTSLYSSREQAPHPGLPWPSMVQQQQQQHGDYPTSSNPCSSYTASEQQQYAGSKLAPALDPLASPFQAAGSSSPETGAHAGGDQQHSSSSMSSGSPMRCTTGAPGSSSTCGQPGGAPARCHSAVDLPAASSRAAVSVADIGLPGGAWAGVLPTSDVLGPMGMRPVGQGKLLSPAAYDMMVASITATPGPGDMAVDSAVAGQSLPPAGLGLLGSGISSSQLLCGASAESVVPAARPAGLQRSHGYGCAPPAATGYDSMHGPRWGDSSRAPCPAPTDGILPHASTAPSGGPGCYSTGVELASMARSYSTPAPPAWQQQSGGGAPPSYAASMHRSYTVGGASTAAPYVSGSGSWGEHSGAHLEQPPPYGHHPAPLAKRSASACELQRPLAFMPSCPPVAAHAPLPSSLLPQVPVSGMPLLPRAGQPVAATAALKAEATDSQASGGWDSVSEALHRSGFGGLGDDILVWDGLAELADLNEQDVDELLMLHT